MPIKGVAGAPLNDGAGIPAESCTVICTWFRAIAAVEPFEMLNDTATDGPPTSPGPRPTPVMGLTEVMWTVTSLPRSAGLVRAGAFVVRKGTAATVWWMLPLPGAGTAVVATLAGVTLAGVAPVDSPAVAGESVTTDSDFEELGDEAPDAG